MKLKQLSFMRPDYEVLYALMKCSRVLEEAGKFELTEDFRKILADVQEVVNLQQFECVKRL